jgi:hypothetical protein
MDQEVARLLAEGQAAARRGDQAMARTLLTQLVSQDPHNEEAWMWLSGVVTDLSEQQICLENALVINPYNQHARRGLEFLVAKTGTPSQILSAMQAASILTSPETEPKGTAVFGEAQPTDYDTAATAVPSMPESWAVPGPEPADPFLATAPYPAPVDQFPAAGNGHPYDTGTGEASGLAATVPYSAAVPAPGDVTHSPAAGDPTPGGSSMHFAGDATQAAGAGPLDGDPGLDIPPFVPPGLDASLPGGSQAAPGFVAHEGGTLGHEDTATDLPAWLESLTPSPPAPEPHDAPYAPFNMSDYGAPAGPAPSDMAGMAGMDNMNNMNNMAGMAGMTGMMAAMNSAPSDAGTPADPNMPFGAPTGMGLAAAMPQMSPFSEMSLPAPHELPGDDGRTGSAQAQPWYLQGSSSTMAPPMPTGGISNYLDSTMLNGTAMGGAAAGVAVLDEQRPKTEVYVQCPNCKQQVPDTSLACPNCKYSFFVNCPHCHELVDTVGAVPGKTEPCPYCKQTINRMELGLGGVQDLVSQKNPGSKPAAAAAMTVAYPAMQQDIPGLKAPRRGLSFNWVVDLLWLVVVVLMVWALTQLPTWLNLPGMY